MMLSFISAVVTIWNLISYFKNKFWTRSLRSVFLVPPFAIAVILFVIAKDSLSSNFDNLRKVMKKRED